MKKLIFVLALLCPMYMFGQNYFKKGAKWIAESYSTESSPALVGHYMAYIGECMDGDEMSLGLYRCDDLNGANPQFYGYIRTDGDKVFIKTTSDSDQWSLIYDFGLKVGDKISVSDVAVPRTILPVLCWSVEENKVCEGWMNIRLENPDFPSGGEEFPDSPVERVNWIKGIGSASGPFVNLYGTSGGGCLAEFWDGDKLVYKDSRINLGVGDISDTSGLKVAVEGLEVSVSGEAGTECLIFSDKGELIVRFCLNDGTARLRLPSEGIYILKAGPLSRKFIAG